jgi:hypothetical protein
MSQGDDTAGLTSVKNECLEFDLKYSMNML